MRLRPLIMDLLSAPLLVSSTAARTKANQALLKPLAEILPLSTTKNTTIPEYLYGSIEAYRAIQTHERSMDLVNSLRIGACLQVFDSDIALVSICNDIVGYLSEDDQADEMDEVIQDLMNNGGVLYDDDEFI